MDHSVGSIIQPLPFDMLVGRLFLLSEVERPYQPLQTVLLTDIAMPRGDVPSDLIHRRVAHRPLGTIPLTDHVGASSIK